MEQIWKNLNITIDWTKEVPLNRLIALRLKFHNQIRSLLSGKLNKYTGKYAKNISDLQWAKNFVNKKIREVESKTNEYSTNSRL